MFFDPSAVQEIDGAVSIRIAERKDGSTYSIDLDDMDGLLMLARKSRAEVAKLSTVWFREVRIREEIVLEPLTYSAARSALRRLIKRAGVKNLTIHDHRHDVATKITRGAGIAVAQSQLGHANIATTRRYVKIAREDRLKGVAAMKSRSKSRDDGLKSEKPDADQTRTG